MVTPASSGADGVRYSPARSQASASALLLRVSADRLVAGTRSVLAAFALVTAAFDPVSDARVQTVLLVALALYQLSAFGRLALTVRALRASVHASRAELASDALIVAVLATTTGWRSASFFTFLVFFIVAAGLRRAPRAVLISGGACFVFFLGAAFLSTTAPTRLDLSLLVMRGLLLVLSTTALAVLAAERQRLLARFTTMASWPVADWSDIDTALFDLLGAAADAVPGSRVALVWSDADEPWTNVALLDDELTLRVLMPTDDAPIDESSPELLAALSASPESIVAARANGQIFFGRLLFLGVMDRAADLEVHAEILARQIAGSLDVWLLARRARELAAREERARLWRDLHDGALQSLTGLALMLERADQIVESNPAESRRVLGEAQELVRAEQRDLRLSILEQKSSAGAPVASETLPTLVTQLARRFEQVWGLSTDVRIAPDVGVSPDMALQVSRMIQEALSNSVRHGKSTEARLTIEQDVRGLTITVEDNGRGFPFIGSFTYRELLEQRIGPVILKDRVQRLHGSLDIRSAPTGVGLDIHIPSRAVSAAI
jgi:signal transduction histidine kinase